MIARKNIDITPAVRAPDGVMGTVYIHEKAVVLIDLRSALRLDEEPGDPERQLILVTSFNQTVNAFLIDRVNKIHRTAWTNFDAVQNDYAGSVGFVTGTVRLDDRVVVILDLERLMLDFEPQREESGMAIPSPERAQNRESVKIVYAEDSRMIRNATMKTLKSAGYRQIMTFDNGATALEYLQRTWDHLSDDGGSIHDYVDLVLTDIEMPKLDGLTLCRQIKENQAHGDNIPVIVYSSLINKEMSQRCKQVGAASWISKPRGDDIIAAIDQYALDQSSVAVG
ncbi:MAG: response regulator [Opitutales bacterium]|nr:response regulator [Opitutales bacterium]